MICLEKLRHEALLVTFRKSHVEAVAQPSVLAISKSFFSTSQKCHENRRTKVSHGTRTQAAGVPHLTRSGLGCNRGHWRTAADEKMAQIHQATIEKLCFLTSGPTHSINVLCSGAANPHTWEQLFVPRLFKTSELGSQLAAEAFLMPLEERSCSKSH